MKRMSSSMELSVSISQLEYGKKVVEVEMRLEKIFLSVAVKMNERYTYTREVGMILI